MSEVKQELRDLSAALIREQEALEAEGQRIRDLPAGHPDIASHAQRVLNHAAQTLAFADRLRLLMAEVVENSRGAT